jgi:cellulose synthase/poly-beta-1,6-N-acetylglucosamine synthase-like glycosyltransferase
MGISTLVSAALVAAAALPVTVLLVQVLAALRRGRDGVQPGGDRPRVAVLMPAHDEAEVIVPTLARLLPELAPGDRVLVVADNCADDTAALARAAGAQVATRVDAERRGKSHALEFGVRHLAADAPEVVVVIDADCLVEPGAIDRLARECGARNRPVQGLYLMHSPAVNGLAGQVAAFAWRVRNWVRPLGMRNLGLACQLMGTGTAFPWAAIREFPIANREMAEDYKFGIDLASAGYPPCFLPGARVSSEFPLKSSAVRSQRTRWEHGHLNLILREVPKLTLRALARRDAQLLGMAIDLAVPPLAFLALLLAAATAAGAAMTLLAGAWWPFAALLAFDAMFAATVLIAWHGWGREAIPGRALAAAPLYALGKIPMYLRFATRRQRVWLKTERDAPPRAAAAPVRASRD